MSQDTAIILNNVHFSLDHQDKPLFAGLSLTFQQQKTAIIGNNGVGKSTLLKLIVGELSATHGQVQRPEAIAYNAQQLSLRPTDTLAAVLGIEEKLAALQRVYQGSIDERDYAIIAEDWQCEQTAISLLAEFGLQQLPLSMPIANLSGGQRMRLALLQQFASDADFIILDEPTNNLDLTSRNILYQKIQSYQKGLIIVSHDRTLLQLMDSMVELSSLGVMTYGGNYDDYCQQKALEQQAAQQQLQDAEKKLKQTKVSMQTTREKHEKNKSLGRKKFLTGSVDKLTAASKKGRSERSQARLSIRNERMLDSAKNLVSAAQEKIATANTLKVDMSASFVPKRKLVLTMEQVTFAYDESPLIDNFNLSIKGPQRLALVGDNGSGKTSLVKLIMGELVVNAGMIHHHIKAHYLDQSIALLNAELTILQNFKLFNPDMHDSDAYRVLDYFLFRNQAALKQVKRLSGGEQLRAALACLLMSQQAPQFLILDEPTNNLDIQSIEVIEQALKNYQGALMVISHDQQFLANINIEQAISAPFCGV